jgi:uncharacterized protein YkwD
VTLSEGAAKLALVLRKKHILVVFATVFALSALVPSAFAARRTSGELSLLQAMNAARSAHGLRPLHLDSTLRAAARSHSVDMLRGNYFAHGNFAGRIAAFHVRASIAGENLAWGSGTYGTAHTIVQEWLASPEHRANLLRPSFSRIGIGIARGPFQGTSAAAIVTADFAG